MSRITKEIAREVAEKLTAKKLKAIQDLDLKQKTILHEFIVERIPKDVMAVYLIRPNYFRTFESFSVCGNGFDYKYLNIIAKLPFYSNSFEPNEIEAKKLNEILNEIEDLKKKYFKILNEIETLLYSLRTYSKVNLEFTEATPFLPENISNKLMVNISDIRNELKL